MSAKSSLPRAWPALLAWVLAWGLAGLCHVHGMRSFLDHPAYDYRPLPARWIKAIASDFDACLADLHWLAFLQHDEAVLASEEPDKNHGDLAGGLDAITTLDPDFSTAYLFGSWALGDAGQGRAAEALLDRGIAHRPRDRELRIQKGFIRMLVLANTAGAISTFLEAAAPPATDEGDSVLRARALRMAAGLAERRHDPDLAARTWARLAEDARRRGDGRMEAIARRALARLGRGGSSVTAGS